MKPRKGYRTCVRCQKNRALRFFANRGTVCTPCQRSSAASRSKDLRLQETYGITLEEWHQIVAIQNGVCGICKTRPLSDVDHSHARENAGVPTRLTVRGILCKTCNRRLLPAAKDNPEWLRAAADFLEEPPAHFVLHN